MAAISFHEQYKHPLWQRKRLEALENVGFGCELCADDQSPLHVHHKRYVKGRAVWEYQLHELAVLCEGCHEQVHQFKDELSTILAIIHPEAIGLLVALIHGFCLSSKGAARIEYFDSLASEDNPDMAMVGHIAGQISEFSSKHLLRLSDAIEINGSELSARQGQK